MVGDSDTWRKAVGNELGRLANEIDNQGRATSTIEFIRKWEVPKGHHTVRQLDRSRKLIM